MQTTIFDSDKIIFLDTETTDASEDARLVQLAYKEPQSGSIVDELFRPPVPISFHAMAVCHITNDMVADKELFSESDEHSKLATMLTDHTLIAHNAPFDIRVLRNEGVETMRSIDTLRIARHMIESESYKLQYLRYSLDLGVEGRAHDAFGDILVLEALYYYLVDLLKVKHALNNDFEVVKKMVELSNTPVLLTTIQFGKHVGKTFEEIARIDHSYLDWLYSSESLKSEHEQNEDLLYTLAEYC